MPPQYAPLLPEFIDDESSDYAESTNRAAQPRSRGGAPLGNTNALKHGFYSRRFNRAELEDLDGIDEGDLEDEIALLRVSMRRVIEWSHDIKSLTDSISYLRVIAMASASLSRLIRARHVMGTYVRPDPFDEELEEMDAEDERDRQIEQTAREIARRLAVADAKLAVRRLASQDSEADI